MDTYLLPCCVYPTEVVTVDDDKNLGKWLTLELSDCSTPCTFTTPEEALAYLMRKPTSTFADRIIGTHNMLDLGLLHLEAVTPAPLETAVIIIDYEMPNMDGITLCKELRDHPAKKMMLTGQADHFIGVQAFNEGLIDRFILKSSKNAGKMIREAVKELQYQYFQEHSHFIWDEVTFETHQKFMKDVLFVHFFKQLMKEYHIEAFYLWKDGSRFLLRDHKQRLFWLMLYDTASLHKIVEKAEYVHEQEPLPENEILLSKIKNHAELPCFYPAFDDAWSLKDWAPFLHAVAPTEGSLDTYYYALIPATGLYHV